MQVDRTALYLNLLSNLFLDIRYFTEEELLASAKQFTALFLGFPDVDEIRIRAESTEFSARVESWIDSASKMVAAFQPLTDELKPIQEPYLALLEQILVEIVNADTAKVASGLAYTFHNLPDKLFFGVTQEDFARELENINYNAQWMCLSEIWLKLQQNISLPLVK